LNVFILEGINDVIFFETLLKFHFKKSNIPKAHGIQFRKGIDKVRRILLGRNYNYIKTNVGLMIYGDNGRPNIINKALPRLVEDTIGRIPDVLKFFTVLDADRFSDEETLDLIENKLKEKNIPFSEIKKYKKNELIIQSTQDPRYMIKLHLFQIPECLEKQLVIEGIKRCGSLKNKEKTRLLNNDPHDSLQEIAKKMRIPKNELIKISITNEWFNKTSWYLSLLSRISSFFS